MKRLSPPTLKSVVRDSVELGDKPTFPRTCTLPRCQKHAQMAGQWLLSTPLLLAVSLGTSQPSGPKQRATLIDPQLYPTQIRAVSLL
jgi:hypothetical protein